MRPERETKHTAGEEGAQTAADRRQRKNRNTGGMNKPQEKVKSLQSAYTLNLERRFKQEVTPEKKNSKTKEDISKLTAKEKQRQSNMTAKVSKSSAQRLSRDLTCSICLDLFKQPVSLPCDHTFCQGCIAGYWAGPRGSGQGGSGSCPQCRKVFPGQSYRPNRIVANIVESYCQGLEESEASDGGVGGRLGDVEGAEKPAAPLCVRHKEELKLYCEEDQELVCLVCGLSQEHRNHNMVCVQEAQQRHRVSQMAERLGSRAVHQKVAGSIPGRSMTLRPWARHFTLLASGRVFLYLL